jgi:hypothetical protein
MTSPDPPLRVGDTVRLRKAHPCGGREWSVTRIGADIGLECRTCGRRVLLLLEEFERRCVSHTPTGGNAC